MIIITMGRKLDSIPIISFKKFKEFKNNIDHVLLAIPSLKRSKKNKLLNCLKILIPT